MDRHAARHRHHHEAAVALEPDLAGTARRRAGTPQDIAHAVMFLASDYADFITGQVLSVTGSP